LNIFERKTGIKIDTKEEIQLLYDQLMIHAKPIVDNAILILSFKELLELDQEYKTWKKNLARLKKETDDISIEGIQKRYPQFLEMPTSRDMLKELDKNPEVATQFKKAKANLMVKAIEESKIKIIPSPQDSPQDSSGQNP